VEPGPWRPDGNRERVAAVVSGSASDPDGSASDAEGGDMDVRRAAVPLAVTGLVLLLAATPASAGGSWLDPDRRAYVPGETARLAGRFDLSGSLTGRISDGPYVAYLLGRGATIAPGEVPAGAIRLGRLHLVTTDGPYPTRAWLSFEVPDVPAGWYHVGYCNDPCTVDGIGDLVGSWEFVVAPSRVAGSTLLRTEELAARLASARESLARSRAERDRLERALDARADEVVRLESALAASDRPPVTPTVPKAEASATWWVALVAAALGVTAGATVAMGRRAPSATFPDTIPDDLEEPALR
jgi:hypothetical protein